MSTTSGCGRLGAPRRRREGSPRLPAGPQRSAPCAKVRRVYRQHTYSFDPASGLGTGRIYYVEPLPEQPLCSWHELSVRPAVVVDASETRLPYKQAFRISVCR